MPSKSSPNRQDIASTIATLTKEKNKDHNQVIAIALSIAKHRKK